MKILTNFHKTVETGMDPWYGSEPVILLKTMNKMFWIRSHVCLISSVAPRHGSPLKLIAPVFKFQVTLFSTKIAPFRQVVVLLCMSDKVFFLN